VKTKRLFKIFHELVGKDKIYPDQRHGRGYIHTNIPAVYARNSLYIRGELEPARKRTKPRPVDVYDVFCATNGLPHSDALFLSAFILIWITFSM
jgi:hypothetical protein